MTDPTDTWRQNFRDLQTQLLETGVFDDQDLSDLRGDGSPSDTAAWARQQGTRILAVDTGQGRAYPSFQFTPTGDVRPELASSLSVLQDAGLSAWITWAWMTEPTGLLSGAVPHEILGVDPARGAAAVQRRAERPQADGSALVPPTSTCPPAT